MGVKVDPKGNSLPRLTQSASMLIYLCSDRTKNISELSELETWTKFTFPGRGTQHSAMEYDWTHFSGVDYDSRRKEHGVFKLVGEGKRSEWASDVSTELGNYDYL